MDAEFRKVQSTWFAFLTPEIRCGEPMCGPEHGLAKQGGFARLTSKPDWRDERRAAGPPKIDLSE